HRGRRRADAADGGGAGAEARDLHRQVPRAVGRRPRGRVAVPVHRARGTMTGVRAIFFDAGNTLIRMDYRVIVAELTRLGGAVTLADVERAEWRARVRLDASFTPGASTEHPDTGERYLRLILDELGVRDTKIQTALADWRRGYNAPMGFWTAMEPEADLALKLARARVRRHARLAPAAGALRRPLARALPAPRHVRLHLSIGTGAGPRRRDARAHGAPRPRANALVVRPPVPRHARLPRAVPRGRRSLGLHGPAAGAARQH